LRDISGISQKDCPTTELHAFVISPCVLHVPSSCCPALYT
jgi:hypothetical protein